MADGCGRIGAGRSTADSGDRASAACARAGLLVRATRVWNATSGNTARIVTQSAHLSVGLVIARALCCGLCKGSLLLNELLNAVDGSWI